METVAYVSKSSQYSASLCIHYGGYGHKQTTTREKMHDIVQSNLDGILEHIKKRNTPGIL
jgi:hypothetical protein